jgi:glutamate-ammonia-ligase adenylyltransferase
MSKLPQLIGQEFDKLWLQYKESSQITKVWACSPFVAKYCLKNINFPNLKTRNELPDIENLDENKLMQVLRIYRQQEMVRIAWNDLAGLTNIEQSFYDLTKLAEDILQMTVNKLYQDLSQNLGIPYNSNNEKQEFVVFAMGKLGGGELNFSSDIDLIFAYPENGETKGGRRSLSNQEFFTRLGQKLIKIINTITADGFVFRVDMRLRPFGDSGALVVDFNSLENYYETHAREWERYALIKCRAIAGNIKAGDEFIEMIKPFIYRRYLDYGVFESLRDLKAQIDSEIRRKNREHDIKLGLGGIREIEFICQAFQLIYGGRQPALQ